MPCNMLVSGPPGVPAFLHPLGKECLIGSDPECDIVLSGPDVAGKQVRFFFRGTHAFLEVCEGAVVERLGLRFEQVRPGNYCRIDFLPFRVGPYTLQADPKRWSDFDDEYCEPGDDEDFDSGAPGRVAPGEQTPGAPTDPEGPGLEGPGSDTIDLEGELKAAGNRCRTPIYSRSCLLSRTRSKDVLADAPRNPRVGLNPGFRNAYLNDRDDEVRRAFRDNDRYDWKPIAAVFLHQGTQGDIVPFFCAQKAYEAMRARGGRAQLYPYLGKDRYQPVIRDMTRSLADLEKA
jgi:hypothetical protein